VFTGLVADLGEVRRVERSGEGTRLTVASELAGELSVDVMNETLRMSSLAEVLAGAAVNLELSLQLSDRLGGHIVQGHVDGVGTISEVRPDGFSRRVTIDAPAELMRYLAFKGSIAVNGISLTVAEVGERSFTVSLIPETLERTNLGQADPGATVNLEVDVVAKYVERLIAG